MEADERRKRWEEKRMRRKSRGEENWEQKGLEQREQESFQTVICRPHTSTHKHSRVSDFTAHWHINFLETYFNLNYDYYLPNPDLNPTLLYPSHLYVKLDWFQMHWFDFCPHKEGMSPAWVMLGHTHTHTSTSLRVVKRTPSLTSDPHSHSLSLAQRARSSVPLWQWSAAHCLSAGTKELGSHSNTHAKDTQYKHSHTL